MNEALQLQKLRDELSRDEVLKDSSLAGSNWGEKKKKLETEFFNLRVSLFEKQIQDLQTAKSKLEKDFKENIRIW